MSRSKNSLARWWGFALVVAVLAALPSPEVPAAILFVLSGLGLVWALFLAPVWCGAVTRKHEPCRNNSWGLLLGCHLREHRWQKFKMMFVSHRWQQLNRGLWSSPAEILATVSGVVTIVGVIVAIVRWIAMATSVA
jgi:hypothetical protein